jgi:hypothetical protein
MKEKFEYNPFSGVLEEDLEKILVPVFDVADISHEIEHADSLAIEFIGKQGRGKTTHLRCLQKKMSNYPIFLLNATTACISDIITHESDVVFVDSIHHVSISDRIQLFRAKRVVIYTTHWSRKFSCIYVGKKHFSIRFKGITIDTLRYVLGKRLQLASKNKIDVDDLFTEKELQSLIRKFGDNYRGIINHLYEQYQ